jgi:hypothetical protein
LRHIIHTLVLLLFPRLFLFLALSSLLLDLTLCDGLELCP